MSGDQPGEDDFDDLLTIDLNPELAISIGCLAAQWSRLELISHLLCIGLMNARGADAYLLTASLGNKTIVDFMNASADANESKSPSFSNGMRLIASEFNRLLGVRNRIVHGNWLDSEDSANMMTFVARFKGKVRYAEEIWNTNQIEQIIGDCLDLSLLIPEFMREHHLDLPLLRWQRETLHATATPRQLAEIPPRDPKMTELALQLLA